ncbi:hypothetical protein NW768_009815 [Fusarium equiseti]|uniref:C2H2-type domain-containing protein n=1 Tax=Fusarium equiseti TaxID=61235 RepID=A0ABQ8R2D4_FUSEQ|nr:hypothetical protein NW768_009815 [Fusarium equiseti]
MEMFVDEAQAEEHVKRSHAYTGVECRTCRQTFSTSYGRERHEKKHTHPVNCPRVFCECRFQSEEEAIEHSGEGRCRSSRNLYICPVSQCRLAVVGIVVPKGVLERHWNKHLEHGHIAQVDKIKYERGDPPPLKRLDLADNIYRHNARCFPDDQKIDNSNDAEDDDESQSLSEATTEANLQPTKDGEPGPSEDMDESGFTEFVELVGSQNLKSPEDFLNFISKVSKGKGKSQLGKGSWFGTALLPDDVEDLFSDVHCGCILAHNVAVFGEHPNIKINFFARGRKCAGPGLGTKWFVTEPCPCDMVIDLDTACLRVTRSRSGITITLCLQCVACQETKKVRRVLHYLEAGSQIQKVDFSFLRNMFRNAAKQQWEVKGKARQHFERIQQRAKEIENGRPGASMIILDDEFTIVGNTLMEFAAVEYMSGNTIINTLIDHDKDIWEISESKKLTVLNYMHMKAVYSAGRGLPLLNVHDVAEMIKNSGITPDTIVLVWHNGTTDLDLLRDFLATGQRGYERLIPNNANCISLLQFFRENLPPIVWENKTGVFPVGLEILFPVIYPGSNLVGRNHQAEVDCCQTRLVMKALEWLCQPISQRGPVWNTGPKFILK